jgi:2-polyprenyl-6-methoxyphenol hydroxylase-like FAD-dependent oxidoreductase
MKSIGIIGAGTAGLAAALAFAREGWAVTVFEKHRALAPLGAGLLIQPQGVAALDALGVGREFQKESVPVTRLLGTCHRGWTLVDVPYDQTEARAVSRNALSQVLLYAALAAGVTVRYQCRVDAVAVRGAAAEVSCAGERQAFDLVVIADGAASVLPAQAGLAVASEVYPWGALWGMFDVEDWPGDTVLEQRFHGTRRMFGLMPTARVGNKLRLSLFWSLPLDSYDLWRQQPLGRWKAELLQLWPEAEPVVSQLVTHDQLAFATYRHAHARRLAAGPVCVIGDAAHAMSPQLGLGSTLAVQDALTLARCVAEFGPLDGPEVFSRRRLRVVRRYQALSRLLTPCFQADTDGLWRDVLFAAGLKAPGVSRLMYRSIAG